jgi:nudix-type nucleoside diphosphatase (YffH/AdpP family)
VAGNLFLYGTLRHLPLLELVSGVAPDTLTPAPANLADYRVRWAKGHGFPLIEQAEGARAEGLLLRDVPQAVQERLDFYELGFGYDLREVAVAGPGGALEPAMIYFPQPGLWQPGAPFALEEWVRDYWAMTRHSAREVMGYMGRLSAQEVARRYKMILSRAGARAAAEAASAPSAVRRAPQAGAVTLRAEQASHEGFYLLKTLALRHVRFDGSQSEEVLREVFVTGDAAILLPYDPVRDRVLLVEQFRIGPYARNDPAPWLLEPVAGRIDGGETGTSTAEREAVEEAGLTLRRVERIAGYYPSPGCSSEFLEGFIGIADLPDGIEGTGGVVDEQEDIRSHVLSFDAAMRLIETGEANSGPLILSLLWLARERARLRETVAASG